MSDYVCPRCGTPVAASRWCSGCGLNLDQQGELPTGEAYAAKRRGEKWLAAESPENPLRPGLETGHQAPRAAESEPVGAAEKRKDQGITVLIALLSILMIGGGIAGFLLLRTNADDDGTTDAAAESQTTGDSRASTDSEWDEDISLTNSVIRPGQGIGPVDLNDSRRAAEQALGPASEDRSSAGSIYWIIGDGKLEAILNNRDRVFSVRTTSNSFELEGGRLRDGFRAFRRRLPNWTVVTCGYGQIYRTLVFNQGVPGPGTRIEFGGERDYVEVGSVAYPEECVGD